MAHAFTTADLKGLRAPALNRIVTAASDAVTSALGITADRFAAHIRSQAGTDKPRDLALAALGQVQLLGGRVEAPTVSHDTLAEGGFLSGATRWVVGGGEQLAHGILVRELAA